MKKQASTLLPALLDLLRQYLALDMAVYAGHATLLLLTASLPLLMWVLVIINMLPFYSVSDIAALVAQLLPDIPAIQSMAVDVIANLNNQSTTFMASFAAITTVISASGGMAAVQKGLQKLTPGARKTMFDRLWAVLYTFLFEGLMLVAMVVQSLSPILRGLAGLLPLHTLVGGLLQRLHSLLSISAAYPGGRAAAAAAQPAQHQCGAFVGAFAADGNTDLHLCARRQAPHTGSAAGGRRCGSGVDAVFQNILVLHRAFLEVIVHLRFFGCNRADYALAECEHQCAVLGCRAERKDSGNGAGEKGTGCLRYTLGRDVLIAQGRNANIGLRTCKPCVGNDARIVLHGGP